MTTLPSGQSSAQTQEQVVQPMGRANKRSIRLDVVAVGVLLAAVGVGWLLDRLGFAVSWRLAAPVALALVGVFLGLVVVLPADGGRGAGRARLAWLGAGLLVVSLALGVDAPRYAAPVGNVTVAPAADEWPVAVQRSMGNVDIDLTRHPLPDRGSVSVQLGTGNVRLILPERAPVEVTTRVTAGQLVVDGRTVANGVDLRWSGGTPGSALRVRIDLGAGKVDVRHA